MNRESNVACWGTPQLFCLCMNMGKLPPPPLLLLPPPPPPPPLVHAGETTTQRRGERVLHGQACPLLPCEFFLYWYSTTVQF
jgi:hypothetical protein